MKTTRLIAVLAVCALTAMLLARGCGRSGFGDWVGRPAPDLTLRTIDDRTIRLSELKGRPVIIDFWATWCGPCRTEIPHFIQLGRDPESQGMTILGVSNEDSATLSSFARENGVNYSIGNALELVSPYADVRAIPTTFFIDREGVIRDIAVGYRSYSQLKKIVTSL